MPSAADLLADARRRLHAAGVEGGDLDARLLVGGAMGLDGAGLMMAGRDAVDEVSVERIAGYVGRRAAGEPVHRILGRRAFYAHEFALSAETLEPRPDTEALVELCRAPIADVIAARGGCLLADIGTGSGAIAVSLLALFPELVTVAVDLSEGALRTARDNAATAGVSGRFLPVACDYLSALSGRFDVIVSNPPYIASGEIAGLAREVRDFDPRLALDGGADGLDAYRALAEQCCARLSADGHVLLEIGQGQASDVSELFRARGLVLAASSDDLGGTTRALHFVKDEAPVA